MENSVQTEGGAETDLVGAAFKSNAGWKNV